MNGDEAAAQAYSGDVEQALSLLRLFYGNEYTFGYDAALGVFWVIRDGLIGSMLTAPAPEALGALVDGNPGLAS